MTGFTRRFLNWWNTRRGIGSALAASVERYIDEHLEEAYPTPLYADSPVAGAPTFGSFDHVESAPMAMSDTSTKMASRPAPALEEMLRTLDASFSETLLQMIDARGLTDSQVYHRAHLSRQHFSKIRGNQAYRPTKATVLCLAVALELSLDETRLLLERAGFSLSHASKADVIVEYFIGHGQHDLNLINRTLYHFDQPILGS